MEAGHDALDVVVVERIEVSLNQLLFRGHFLSSLRLLRD